MEPELQPSADASLRRFLLGLVLLPLHLLLLLHRPRRPCPAWSYRQAASVHVVRLAVMLLAARAKSPPLSLAPGKEGARFALFQRAPDDKYTGIVKSDAQVNPGLLGATWYPAALSSAPSPGKFVLLHFHGGAYVMGDGRDKDSGFLARTLLSACADCVSHVVCPQYRIATGARGMRFPAALQDAITAYCHLVNVVGIPERQIVLSGDSAGGNLALALMRYLNTHESTVGLQPPAATLLWSPWFNPVGSLYHADDHERSRHAKSDYTTGAFGLWGATRFQPAAEAGIDVHNVHVQVIGNHFPTKVPVFVAAGQCEVFSDDIDAWTAEMQRIEGNRVERYQIPNAPHDVLFAGSTLGFKEEARGAAERAARFLQGLAGGGGSSSSKSDVDGSLQEKRTAKSEHGKVAID